MNQTINKYRETFAKLLSEIYPRQEIEAIFRIAIEHVLGKDFITLVTNSDIVVSQRDEAALNHILLRLKKSEPIQHITGKAHFYDLEFIVNQHVLIPRQETELLVDEIIKRYNKSKKLTLLDIGTGSGCIAISLKKNLVNADVYAIDISDNALETAKKNAELNQVMVRFQKADILEPNLQMGNQFDIILSNPPYVRNSERKLMHKNVVDFDPGLALFVEDHNPLVFYERITQFSKVHLNPGGILAFEINEAFGKEMLQLMTKNGFMGTELIKDLDGRDRIVIGRKF